MIDKATMETFYSGFCFVGRVIMVVMLTVTIIAAVDTDQNDSNIFTGIVSPS